MSKARTRKPTQQDFEVFKAEFLRCVDILNLNDWKVDFSFEPLAGSYAEIETTDDVFMALVKFSSSSMSKIEDECFDPERTARHEAAHLFHSRLVYFGRCRYMIPDTFSEEDERLCRVMEKLLEEKDMIIEHRHIGDGVYASYDGMHIVLDLRKQDCTTRICLDGATFASLIRFRDDVTQTLIDQEKDEAHQQSASHPPRPDSLTGPGEA